MKHNVLVGGALVGLAVALLGLISLGGIAVGLAVTGPAGGLVGLFVGLIPGGAVFAYLMAEALKENPR